MRCPAWVMVRVWVDPNAAARQSAVTTRGTPVPIIGAPGGDLRRRQRRPRTAELGRRAERFEQVDRTADRRLGLRLPPEADEVAGARAACLSFVEHVAAGLPQSDRREVGGVGVVEPSGAGVLVTANGLPPGSSFDPSTQVFSWTPAYGSAGTYPNVTFTATDGNLSTTAQVVFKIAHVQQPVAVKVTFG